MLKAIYILLVIAIVSGISGVLYSRFVNESSQEPVAEDQVVMCTMDALECPDGSFVGRTGPKCEFVCPSSVQEPVVPSDVQTSIDTTSDMIVVDSIESGSVIESGMMLTGKARGGWYFEASFPVTVVNWDGLIIAEAPATAQSEWMTSEFVPFSVPLNFVSPFKPGEPDFMKRGAIILQKDNPSGLPENDDAIEIPIQFAP